jgi:hypothetical protein
MASPDDRQARKEQRKERKTQRSERRGERKRQHVEEEDGRARLLGKLLHCRDEELAGFKAKRLPETSAATAVDLHRARRVLEGVAAILASADADALARLAVAESALLSPSDHDAGEPEATEGAEAIERPALAAPPPTVASPIARAPKPTATNTDSPWSAKGGAPRTPSPLPMAAIDPAPAVAPTPAVAATAVAPPPAVAPTPAVAATASTAVPRVEASPWARRDEAPLPPRIIIDDEPTRAVDYDLVPRNALPFSGDADHPFPTAHEPHPEGGSTSFAFAAPKDEARSPVQLDASAMPERVLDETPEPIDDEATAIGDPLASTAAPVSKASGGVDLPFKRLPELSVEQYASLCAEREHRPAQGATICQRWGIDDEAAERALDDRWQRRLQADPAEAHHFYSLVGSYKAWLASQG